MSKGEAKVEQRGQRAELERDRALGAGATHGQTVSFVRLIQAVEIPENVSLRPVYLRLHHTYEAPFRALLALGAYNDCLLRTPGHMQRLADHAGERTFDA